MGNTHRDHCLPSRRRVRAERFQKLTRLLLPLSVVAAMGIIPAASQHLYENFQGYQAGLQDFYLDMASESLEATADQLRDYYGEDAQYLNLVIANREGVPLTELNRSPANTIYARHVQQPLANFDEWRMGEDAIRELGQYFPELNTHPNQMRRLAYEDLFRD
ncbi:MAG: hypothetical protein V3T77_11095 [Planctomycetota bacterium]